MIYGYEYVGEMPELAIWVKEDDRGVVHFLLVRFKPTSVSSYRLTWMPDKGRFKQGDDFHRFKKQSPEQFEAFWSAVTTASLENSLE